jgi:uncharacterized protein (TIGR02145 family)
MKHIKQSFLFLITLIVILFSSCDKEEVEEKIIERGSVTDIDGNQYTTVKIGDQWWMAENLRVTKYNDGTALNYIDQNNSDSLWANTTEASYTFINDTIFGHLYNGNVVLSDKSIAPVGWHIPSDEEWKTMEEAVGMAAGELGQTGWRGEVEAEKLSTKYSAGWPEGGVLFGSDEFGFAAIPGGCRIFDGRTNISSNTAFWWTSSTSDSDLWYRYIDAKEKRIFRQHIYTQYGMSIRCVKD